MKFKDYWPLIRDNISVNYEKDYLIEAYREFKIFQNKNGKY
jgi:hypothetical protein